MFEIGFFAIRGVLFIYKKSTLILETGLSIFRIRSFDNFFNYLKFCILRGLYHHILLAYSEGYNQWYRLKLVCKFWFYKNLWMALLLLPVWSLRWRHNDQAGVSNHQPHGCLLNRLFRHRSKKTSKLRVTGLCAGNSPGPVNSPHKGPVTRKMFSFDDVIMWNFLEADVGARLITSIPIQLQNRLRYGWYCLSYDFDYHAQNIAHSKTAVYDMLRIAWKGIK